MRNIKIFQMGPLISESELDLSKVVRMAKKATNIFNFSLGDRINTVGSPGQDGQYGFSYLANNLKGNRAEDELDVLIGVIDSQIYDELYSSIDEDNQCIIISIKGIESILHRARRSYTDYLLCEIGAQLLALELRRTKNISAEPEDCEQPWHKETKSCLFDYDENRDDTFKKLMSPQLCPKCEALFAEENVRVSVQTACLKIVKAGIRPKIAALIETIQNKYVWGLFVVLLGISGRAFLDSTFVLLIWYSIGFGIITIGIYIKNYKNQSNKF